MTEKQSADGVNSTPLLGFLLVILVMIGLWFVCWKAQRWLNWKFDYSLRVKATQSVATNVTWIGHPSVHVDHETIANITAASYVPGVDIGLREDGIIVWREHE